MNGTYTPHAPACVLVLLATFNGAQFLREQLDSIFSQTHLHTKVLCRDDGSTDGTQKILEEYQLQFPQHFIFVKDSLGNLGVKKSFSELMRLAIELTDDSTFYFALADQDDIWVPQKLNVLLQALQTLEATNRHHPALAHSDLCVVDEEMQTIAAKLSKYQGITPARSSFFAQLVSNTVTGCATLFNRALLLQVVPVPSQSMMHDHWMSLVSSAFGHRVFIDQSLVYYRQHSQNTLGARAINHTPIFHKLKPSYFFKRLCSHDQRPIFKGLALQADNFLNTFGHRLALHHRLGAWIISKLDRLPPPLQRLIFKMFRYL